MPRFMRNTFTFGYLLSDTKAVEIPKNHYLYSLKIKPIRLFFFPSESNGDTRKKLKGRMLLMEQIVLKYKA